jgi:hypothetical protein
MNSLQTDNWIKPSYKRGGSTQDGTNKETKHAKQSEHWLNPTPTSNRSSHTAARAVKVQPKTFESYGIITKALAEKRTQFHTYKLKEERTYRVVLKICTTPSTLKISKPKLKTYGTRSQIYGT